MTTAAVAYTGVCFVSGWQAFHGLASIAFDTGNPADAAVSVLLLIAAFTAVLLALVREGRASVAA